MKIYLPSREIHDMTDTTVDVVSTSATTADASPIVLAQTDMLRLKFLPTLVDNGKEPEKSVSGKLLYEKSARAMCAFRPTAKIQQKKFHEDLLKSATGWNFR